MLQYYMRQPNLDSFWSRQASTVGASGEELKSDLRLVSELGLLKEKAFPSRGPFPVAESVGMAQACVMLKRTQMDGSYSEYVQYNTTRKHRSAFLNVWHSTPQVLLTSLFSNETRKMKATTCPVYGEWYSRFMQGVNEMMGGDVRPDLGISGGAA